MSLLFLTADKAQVAEDDSTTGEESEPDALEDLESEDDEEDSRLFLQKAEEIVETIRRRAQINMGCLQKQVFAYLAFHLRYIYHFQL